VIAENRGVKGTVGRCGRDSVVGVLTGFWRRGAGVREMRRDWKLRLVLDGQIVVCSQVQNLVGQAVSLVVGAAADVGEAHMVETGGGFLDLGG